MIGELSLLYAWQIVHFDMRRLFSDAKVAVDFNSRNASIDFLPSLFVY